MFDIVTVNQNYCSRLKPMELGTKKGMSHFALSSCARPWLCQKFP